MAIAVTEVHAENRKATLEHPRDCIPFKIQLYKGYSAVYWKTVHDCLCLILSAEFKVTITGPWMWSKYLETKKEKNAYKI